MWSHRVRLGTTQKYFCCAVQGCQKVGFILLSISISHLYFSDSYFILYGILKFAANSNCIKTGVHQFLWLGAPGLGHPEPLATGPRGPLSGSNGDTARARATASSSSAIAGARGRARARDLVLSTRKRIAHSLGFAPLATGHRRRS